MKRLKNYMEDLVKMYMDNLIKDMDICKCEQCCSDIMAIALNNLPSKYVVTNEGETYSKTSILIQQFEIDVISEITKAIEMVRKNPRHS